MIAALYGAAAVAFFGTATLYFRGRFGAALAGGVIYGVSIAWVVLGSMGSIAATLVLATLLVGPYVYVGIHILDARKGLFLLPTIYSIPLAFLAGAALLAVAGLAVVFLKIFLSAGEPSGVHIGATLMRTLKRRVGDDLSFAGLGGPGMIDEGLRLIYDPARTATMWLWGNLKRVPAHRRALKACIEDWERDRPDVVVTIDYQAFHLYIGTRARALGIPVVHFVGSQFWARRYYTLEPIRRAYSHVLVIHEFEKKYYDDAGVPATYVGHPLFERLTKRRLDHALTERLRARESPRLGILPGSRGGEIRASLPVMLGAAAALTPRPRIVVSAAREESRPFIEEHVARSGLDAEIVDFGSGEILGSSELALITSGSASMEAVYYSCPAIVLYRLGWLNYFFAKPHITCHIAQPNLIAGREILPEFLLPSSNPAPVARAAQTLLDDAAARDQQRAEFGVIKKRLLASPTPSEAAADVVLRYANTVPGSTAAFF